MLRLDLATALGRERSSSSRHGLGGELLVAIQRNDMPFVAA
jgi:hypothetical protein